MADARPLRAGALYFLVVFAAGFALGTVRTLLIAPRVGELPAILIELPVILAVAWLVCGWVIRRTVLGRAQAARWLMGLSALAWLMLAELALALLLFGETPQHYASRLVAPAGLAGLAGQVGFALFPLWRLR